MEGREGDKAIEVVTGHGAAEVTEAMIEGIIA